VEDELEEGVDDQLEMYDEEGMDEGDEPHEEEEEFAQGEQEEETEQIGILQRMKNFLSGYTGIFR
jgi:hypothetical protein